MAANYEIPLQNTAGYYAYSLADQLVLFNSNNASLCVLSEFAAWLFLSLDAGYSASCLKQELIAKQVNIEGFDETLDELTRLLQSDAGSTSYKNEYTELVTPAKTDMTDLPRVFSVSLLGNTFHVYTPCTRLKKYFMDIAVPAHAESESAKPRGDFHITIEESGDGYELRCNTALITKIPDYSHIMPILMDNLQILAYQFSDYLLSVHSAMLAYRGKGIILPGISGSGKSTLALSLQHKGYRCFSDEIAVISATEKLMPLPLPVAIKSGSWKIIRNTYPEIDTQPIWYRQDGRRLKYIFLPDQKTHPGTRYTAVPLEYIIFPYYNEQAKDYELVQCNSLDTLHALTQAGYQIKDSLTRHKVEKILQLVAKTPAYHLSYSSLEQAHQAIKEITS